MSDALREAGALPIEVPLTATLPPLDPEALVEAVRDVSHFDWLVVTSARAVRPLSEAMRRAGIEVGTLPALGVRICAVGSQTGRALTTAGLTPVLIPSRFLGEGLVEAMVEQGVGEGARVLLPRAEEGRDTIPRLLTAAGATVTVVPAYRTAPIGEEGDRLCRLVVEGAVDVLTFTAGSAATVFADAWSLRVARGHGPGEGGRALPAAVGVIALGPATAEVLSRAGLRIDRIADPHTFEGIVAAIVHWAAGRRLELGGAEATPAG